MTADKVKKDRHFPVFALDNPLRKFFNSPQKYCCYVEQGQVVADLGCGPGFYTIPLAERVGPEGRVYAVDSDEKVIRVIERKAARHQYHNIDAHVSSAADLSFIEGGLVDFVLADGLLCSMAPRYHKPAINEIKRILKASGKAFLAVAKGSMSYVDKEEWEAILDGFNVEQRNFESFSEDRWAVVSQR